MEIKDYEIFKFSENIYREFINKGTRYLLNQHPYLDVVLTDHCNSNCNFCIADLIHTKLNCDIDLFKNKILFAINKMNVDEVLLLGGEPTVSKDLLPMLKWLKTLKLSKVVMTTNGVRLALDPKFRVNILSSGLTHLNISFMNTNTNKQSETVNSKRTLTLYDLGLIYSTASKYGVKVRINNNIFRGNNDTLDSALLFYYKVQGYCDSVKFSPLFPVDNFSVLNIKTNWVKNNILSEEYVENLFNQIEDYFSATHLISIIENHLQFGFVKNTMIPLIIPIIMNWNFGKYTGMMKKVTEESKINNLKLLPNNELSLSWNREQTKYYIKT